MNALSSDGTTAQSSHLADLTRDLAAKVENAAIGVNNYVCCFTIFRALSYSYSSPDSDGSVELRKRTNA